MAHTLAACLLAILLTAAQAAPAKAAAPESAAPESAAQLRAALYHALMAEILSTGVESASEGARWSLGPVNPYPSLRGDKVISACIDWDGTTLEAVDWSGYAYYYDRAPGLDRGQAPRDGGSARLKELEERAQAFCRRYEAVADCWCQLVDRNGRNALTPPEWFLRSRLPQAERR